MTSYLIRFIIGSREDNLSHGMPGHSNILCTQRTTSLKYKQNICFRKIKNVFRIVIKAP